MTEVSNFEGGNQPTGLDVSNNGRYLCFSNFQDKNIELYSIEMGVPEEAEDAKDAETSAATKGNQ